MKLHQVAIQLYTLRDHCKTASDLAATLRKVREIGYPAIQVSGIGPIPVEEIVSIANGEGLKIVATHEPAQQILDEPQKVVDRLQKLGVKYTAYPFPAGVNFTQSGAASALANRLDTAGAVLAEAGQVLCYHNHHQEFYRIDGRTVLEILFAETDPANLQGELDTYWVHYGGADPVAWCKKLPNRLPLLHLKDYKVEVDGKVNFSEIGQGNLDFPAIIAAAEASGTEWFIVEQDTTPGDPFDSIRISFDYIKNNLVTV